MIKSTKIKKESFVPAEKFATISVLNNSTVVNDDEIKTAIPDFQATIDEDFTPFFYLMGIHIFDSSGKLFS